VLGTELLEQPQQAAARDELRLWDGKRGVVEAVDSRCVGTKTRLSPVNMTGDGDGDGNDGHADGDDGERVKTDISCVI
jgi:hypothetical protein